MSSPSLKVFFTAIVTEFEIISPASPICPPPSG